jgi:hypothetical protein
MPRFDFKCPDCDSIKTDVYVKKAGCWIKCKCGCRKMIRLLSRIGRVDVFPANGVYLEHVSAKGKTFYSKHEMRQFEKENKMELHYLE